MLDLEVMFGSLISSLLPLVGQFFWLFILLVIVAVVRSPWFKGILGEWIVNFIIKKSFKQPDYFLFKDVLLPTEDGTTQVDHILLSRFGIFVIETKNMKGWIFGKENQPKWTQQIYKHKSTFQNPMRQNFKHKRILESIFEVETDKVKSVIVFVGEARFKTNMPINVIYSNGLKKYIKSFTKECFTHTEISDLVLQLNEGKLTSNIKNNRDHVKHVKSIQSSKRMPSAQEAIQNSSNIEGVCPKCSNSLILRTVSKGANKGKQFYGCSSFPKCRYTKS